jgi:hypothetical protein
MEARHHSLLLIHHLLYHLRLQKDLFLLLSLLHNLHQILMETPHRFLLLIHHLLYHHNNLLLIHMEVRHHSLLLIHHLLYHLRLLKDLFLLHSLLHNLHQILMETCHLYLHNYLNSLLELVPENQKYIL